MDFQYRKLHSAVRAIALSSAMLFLLAPLTGCKESVNVDSNEKQYFSQSESIAQLDLLQDYFYGGHRPHKTYPDYSLIYPDWYAGVYMDDRQQAVVMVVGNSPEIIELIQNVTLNDTIKVEEGKHSFNQMLDAIRTLWEVEKYPFSYMTRLDEVGNAVVVTIDAALSDEEKTEAVALIKANFVQSEVLVFEFGNVGVIPG